MERTVAELPEFITVMLRGSSMPISWPASSVDDVGLISEVSPNGTLNLSHIGRHAFSLMSAWIGDEDGAVEAVLDNLPAKTNVAQLLVDLGALFEATCEPLGDMLWGHVKGWLFGRRGFTGRDLRHIEAVFEQGIATADVEELMVEWFVSRKTVPLSEGTMRLCARDAPCLMAHMLVGCLKDAMFLKQKKDHIVKWGWMVEDDDV